MTVYLGALLRGLFTRLIHDPVVIAWLDEGNSRKSVREKYAMKLSNEKYNGRVQYIFSVVCVYECLHVGTLYMYNAYNVASAGSAFMIFCANCISPSFFRYRYRYRHFNQLRKRTGGIS